MALELLLCLLLYISHSVASNIWLPGFSHLFWVSSAVTPNGRWLYIDGGEIWNGTDVDENVSVMQSTAIIDLTRSWTNTSLPLLYSAPKPVDFPFARAPVLWYSPHDNSLYSRGGLFYKYWDCPGDCTGWSYNGKKSAFADLKEPSAATLWQLKTDETGLANNSWTAAPEPANAVGLPTYGGSVSATTSGDFWHLGGFFYRRKSEQFAVSGLTRSDGLTGEWRNITTSPPMYSMGGQAVSAPQFGKDGVLIFLGGLLAQKPFFVFEGDVLTQDLRAMTDVSIYDIESGRFFTQTVDISEGSETPDSRLWFCAVGVQDKLGHLDIFVYGGQSQSVTLHEVSGPIYILSIPEFRWTAVESGSAFIKPRSAQTCELVGQRQMVTVGGTDGSWNVKSDPSFTNGIGVFDMSALAWVSQYNPAAKPYVRNKSLMRTLKASEAQFNSGWDDPALAKIFALQHSKKNTSPASSSSSDISSNTGAVVAGIVAGIVITFVLLAVSIWCVIRRRRHRQEMRMQQNKPERRYGELSTETTIVELSNNVILAEMAQTTPVAELSNDGNLKEDETKKSDALDFEETYIEDKPRNQLNRVHEMP